MTPAELRAALDRLRHARDNADAAGRDAAVRALTSAMFLQIIIGKTEGVDLTRGGERA